MLLVYLICIVLALVYFFVGTSSVRKRVLIALTIALLPPIAFTLYTYRMGDAAPADAVRVGA
jgi:hypothetical protein